MPFFTIGKDEVKFPPAHFADADGLLAEGGDITAEWLLEGYRSGVFLWAGPMDPLKWYSPDPRVVLYPERLDVPGYVKDSLQFAPYKVTTQEDFAQGLAFCERIENAKPMYPGWITGLFAQAYQELNQKGFVRSVQVWKDDRVVGAAFGTKINQIFFCEHVCGDDDYAAEMALITLAQNLEKEGVVLMDLHRDTTATIDIGLSEISKNEYLHILQNNL